MTVRTYGGKIFITDNTCDSSSNCFYFFTFKQEGGEWEEMELRRNCPNLVTSSVSLLFPPSQESLQLALVHMAWPVWSMKEVSRDCNCEAKHYKNIDML